MLALYRIYELDGVCGSLMLLRTRLRFETGHTNANFDTIAFSGPRRRCGLANSGVEIYGLPGFR